ncbi:MAG TPA: ATP-binding protein [Gammaproteobacteria bacterium]|jgi:predicted AAA+ superfamily ATPase|nr:ATP-binding protein [Gammaproteobacteria bacterium]
MYKRHITESLKTALADTPAVFLNGARQTGKSTLVKSLFEPTNAHYLTFDNPNVLAAAKHDPLHFIQGQRGAVILDEVQKAPEIFPIIKMAIDQTRTPGRFLLTGSTNILLLPRISESLAGRMEILNLYPLSQGEIHGQREHFIEQAFDKNTTFSSLKYASIARDTLIHRMLSGGYPEPYHRTESRRFAWFDAYITTLLQRDVRDLANIEGLTQLPHLLKLLATRIACLTNFSDLSRDIQLPQTTLKRYFTLLETTFLCFTVPAWSNNLGSRLVKSPKLYLNDTGLIASLLDAHQKRIETNGSMLGRLLENFIVAELLKQNSWSKYRTEFYHFRTPKGQEVDLILENRQGECVGVEIKASSTLSQHDLTGLKTFADMAGEKFIRGILLYMGSEVIPLGKNLIALPIAAIFN